jgi:hypothetical protein
MLKRLLPLAASVLLAATSPLQAQTGTYVLAGWTEAHRDSAAPLTSASDTPNKSLVPGFSVSAGRWIRNRLAVEGGITVLRSQSFPWYFTYTLAPTTTSEVASNRDIVLTGALRAVVIRNRNMRLDVLGGTGWTRHSATSVTVAECGDLFHLPCTPVSPRESDRLSSLEPMFTLGVDAPIRASNRVAIVPSFRVLAISRRQWLTEYYHRGPAGGSGVITTFGVGVMFGTWGRASEPPK